MMQLYFMKSTYTNNVIKRSEFFLSGDYKTDANKMLDINFRPDDGLTQFITKNITLPDDTSIRDHTHCIIPSQDKIYKIISTDYLNSEQYQITMEEDPFLGQYLTLESTDIFRTRSNDPDDFRGVNDVADQTLKETVTTEAISPTYKTGKWALLFFQFDVDVADYGIKFYNDTISTSTDIYEQFISHGAILSAYPEIVTDEPELVDYYQKIVYDYVNTQKYQCVWGKDGSNPGKLYWMKYNEAIIGVDELRFKTLDVGHTRLNGADVRNIVVAMPFESTIKAGLGSDYVLTYNNFTGPEAAGQLIDVKIVNDLVMPISSVSYIIDDTANTMSKGLGGNNGWVFADAYLTGMGSTFSGYKFMIMYDIEQDIDISPDFADATPTPLNAEPFYKYDLYVFGKSYRIPYYLLGDINLLIAINSGVINYIVYYNNKRNILASGSFTHSIRYQVDQLDAFYNQNPTYKDQFNAKIASDFIKTTVGGAIGGSVVPGLGTAVGAAAGLASATVDAGIAQLNLYYQEQGLRLKPEQIFGEISEITLQLINVFGVYWVRRAPENTDQMKREYELRGFPTLKFDAIEDMDWTSSTIFGNCKIVFGELKTVIRNEYTTAFINEKLKQGVVIIQ